MLTLKQLLAKGFFPKELPPAFSTEAATQRGRKVQDQTHTPPELDLFG